MTTFTKGRATKRFDTYSGRNSQLLFRVRVKDYLNLFGTPVDGELPSLRQHTIEVGSTFRADSKGLSVRPSA